MKEPTFNVTPVLISVNPSTHRGIFDYSNNLIAFASGPLVYIASLPLSQTFCSLKGHRQVVNAVKWLGTSVVSAGGEGSLVQWQCKDDPAGYGNWELFKEYAGVHKSSVEMLAVLPKKEQAYMLSYSIDGTLVYWKSAPQEFSVVTTLNFGTNLLEAIALHQLDNKSNLIVIGGFASQIHIYLHLLDTDKLSYKCSLQGHQNSIRDFAFAETAEGDLLLASGSMDASVRLWKIRRLGKEEMKEGVVVFEETSGEEAKLHEQYRSKASYVFEGASEGEYYNAVLESLLSYHTEGINSVEWGAAPGHRREEKMPIADLRLLSGGIDGAICCWEHEETTWNVVNTFGEMNAGTRNAVYRALFSAEDCTELAAYTYNGCIFRWIHNASTHKWEPGVVPTGHFGPVNDVTWNPSGRFLVSCSSDMQTKIYGKCGEKWHEISRPQVHGYEINGIVALPAFELPDSKMDPTFRLISAADEKVLRVFDAPYLFNKTANELTSASIRYSATMDNESFEKKMESSAMGGSITQPLTLMNKSVPLREEEGDPSKFNPETFLSNKPQQTLTDIAYLNKKEPPQEHFLSNFALWPESQKMYGHAYEVQCLAVSHNFRFIASSAKSSRPKDSCIMVWDSRSLQEAGKLFGHQLSVTQMEFSHDDSTLLSVGRDRQWILHGEYLGSGKIVQRKQEAHKRAIWTCNWADDDQMFVTASREKKNSIKFWRKREEWEMEGSIPEASNVSAIKFFPGTGGKMVMAGTEEGDFVVWARAGESWNAVYKLNPNLSHGAAIHKIVFNKRPSKKGQWLLASGSADRSVRMFTITLQ